MSGQSGADRVDDAIMTAIDLVADAAQTGDVGKVEIPVRRSLTDDDRVNLREYAELAGVEIAIFRDHIDVTPGERSFLQAAGSRQQAAKLRSTQHAARSTQHAAHSSQISSARVACPRGALFGSGT